MCRSACKWSESIGPFVHIFGWAFNLVDALPVFLVNVNVL